MKKIFFAVFIFLFGFVVFAESEEQAFFYKYTKMQAACQNRLVLMNKSGNMAKLGTEELKGLISGTLTYKTKVTGLSGVVTMHFDNFCDSEGWIFNGDIITKANMSGNGSFDGVMSVSGEYNGKIFYENLILKDSQAGGGTYGIQIDGKNRIELPYTHFFEAMK